MSNALPTKYILSCWSPCLRIEQSLSFLETNSILLGWGGLFSVSPYPGGGMQCESDNTGTSIVCSGHEATGCGGCEHEGTNLGLSTMIGWGFSSSVDDVLTKNNMGIW